MRRWPARAGIAPGLAVLFVAATMPGDAAGLAEETADAGGAGDAAEADQPIGFVVPRMYSGFSWDVEFEAGWAVWAEPRADLAALLRARIGVLAVVEPWFVSVAATFDHGGLANGGPGLGAVVTNLWWGLWAEALVAMSHRADAVLAAGVGWSVAGVEAQFSPVGDGWDVLLAFKLRVPLGILSFGASI